jgi:DNA-directed RNA polymerase specialized sigma24 family protein
MEDLAPLLPASDTFSEASNTFAKPPDEMLEACEEARTLQYAITTLKPRERAIIERRLAGEQLKGIADSMGVPRSQLQWDSDQAVLKIKDRLAAAEKERKS